MNYDNIYIEHLVEKYGLMVNATTAGEILQRPQKFISELINNNIIRAHQCINKSSHYKDCLERSSSRKYQISVIDLGKFLSKLYDPTFPTNFTDKERIFLSGWYKFSETANIDDYQENIENNANFQRIYHKLKNKY